MKTIRHLILAPLKKPVKRLVSPRGNGGVHDMFAFAFWEVYARLQGARTRLKARMPLAPSHQKPLCLLKSAAEYTGDFFLEHIRSALLPFWERHSPDRRYGGFITHLDRQGQVYKDDLKATAMQGRMVCAFSIGYELFRSPTYLELAREGVRFLIENMWDKQRGGWYKSVYRNGRVREPDKNSFQQAYVLLGLVEYHRVTQDQTALDYAVRTYRLLEQRVWDKNHLGYYESCQSDWKVKSDAKMSYIQLVMLTAIMALHEATKEAAYLERARQIADVIVLQMVDRKYGCVLERFHTNWVYDPMSVRGQALIGHNSKAAWLLLRMHQVTGVPEYYTTAERILDFTLRHGWDAQHGGFYQYVYRNGILASTEKPWWTQGEGMQALVLMYALSGQRRYIDYFKQLADFTFGHFFDPEWGEWFTACQADGRVIDDHKGGTWKAAYDTVRACYEAYRCLLSENRHV
ncbi:MAG TPA: AGE family epimerase/isomerase [Candidatus Limnocylindrales bacterium]|nr:AGE family epimerase/isomerase [Candidatus Limnocylindrales bacterium]